MWETISLILHYNVTLFFKITELSFFQKNTLQCHPDQTALVSNTQTSVKDPHFVPRMLNIELWIGVGCLLILIQVKLFVEYKQSFNLSFFINKCFSNVLDSFNHNNVIWVTFFRHETVHCASVKNHSLNSLSRKCVLVLETVKYVLGNTQQLLSAYVWGRGELLNFKWKGFFVLYLWKCLFNTKNKTKNKTSV